MKNQRGEIATILTLVSLGLMLAGIVVGKIAVQQATQTQTKAYVPCEDDSECDSGICSNGKCKSVPPTAEPQPTNPPPTDEPQPTPEPKPTEAPPTGTVPLPGHSKIDCGGVGNQCDPATDDPRICGNDGCLHAAVGRQTPAPTLAPPAGVIPTLPGRNPGDCGGSWYQCSTPGVGDCGNDGCSNTRLGRTTNQPTPIPVPSTSSPAAPTAVPTGTIVGTGCSSSDDFRLDTNGSCLSCLGPVNKGIWTDIDKSFCRNLPTPSPAAPTVTYKQCWVYTTDGACELYNEFYPACSVDNVFGYTLFDTKELCDESNDKSNPVCKGPFECSDLTGITNGKQYWVKSYKEYSDECHTEISDVWGYCKSAPATATPVPTISSGIWAGKECYSNYEIMPHTDGTCYLCSLNLNGTWSWIKADSTLCTNPTTPPDLNAPTITPYQRGNYCAGSPIGVCKYALPPKCSVCAYGTTCIDTGFLSAACVQPTSIPKPTPIPGLPPVVSTAANWQTVATLAREGKVNALSISTWVKEAAKYYYPGIKHKFCRADLGECDFRL